MRCYNSSPQALGIIFKCTLFSTRSCLNGKKHSGQMGEKCSKVKNQEKYNRSGQLRYVVKYKVRNMAKSLLRYHCYCPMVLMQTTNTAVFESTSCVLIGFLAKFHK